MFSKFRRSIVAAFLSLSVLISGVAGTAVVVYPTSVEAGVVSKAVKFTVGRLVVSALRAKSPELAKAAGRKLLDHIRQNPDHFKTAASLLRQTAKKDPKIASLAAALEHGALQEAKLAAFGRYLGKLEHLSGVRIPSNQVARLSNYLMKTDLKKLDPPALRKVTNEYNGKRSQMIKEWERETGQSWPKYPDSSVRGKMPGDNYDLHHIIEKQYGGPNEWWNSFPARNGANHQGTIHNQFLREFYDVFR